MAWYVANEDVEASLRTHLSQTLPNWMCPSRLIRLDQLPLTSNGKVDREALPRPQVTTADPETLDASTRATLGLRRLPQSLTEALDELAASDAAAAWMGPVFHDAYLRHKRFEAELMADLSPEEQCKAYAEVY